MLLKRCILEISAKGIKRKKLDRLWSLLCEMKAIKMSEISQTLCLRYDNGVVK